MTIDLMTQSAAKRRFIELLNEIWPDDLTDNEATTLAAVLQQALDRKHAGVINLNSVRTHPRRKR